MKEHIPFILNSGLFAFFALVLLFLNRKVLSLISFAHFVGFLALIIFTREDPLRQTVSYPILGGAAFAGLSFWVSGSFLTMGLNSKAMKARKNTLLKIPLLGMIVFFTLREHLVDTLILLPVILLQIPSSFLTLFRVGSGRYLYIVISHLVFVAAGATLLILSGNYIVISLASIPYFFILAKPLANQSHAGNREQRVES